MELTHSVIVTYEKILHKQFNYAPSYSAAIQAKVGEMTAAGKTDGTLYFLPDDVRVARNFASLEAAMEWAAWISDFNATHDDVNMVGFQISPNKFIYDKATSTADDDARAARAATLVTGA